MSCPLPCAVHGVSSSCSILFVCHTSTQWNLKVLVFGVIGQDREVAQWLSSPLLAYNLARLVLSGLGDAVS